nr:LysE family transporter [Marinicella sp. W31]MDC2875539.1 LysE family transporter [Marinicella sp. W31]
MKHRIHRSILRYAGGGYLLFLAYKAARSAFRRGGPSLSKKAAMPHPIRTSYLTGLGFHLTNPKAIFFFAALFGIGMPSNVSAGDLALAVVAVGAQTGTIPHCYALGFSLPAVRRVYLRMARWIDGTESILFAGARSRCLRREGQVLSG